MAKDLDVRMINLLTEWIKVSVGKVPLGKRGLRDEPCPKYSGVVDLAEPAGLERGLGEELIGCGVAAGQERDPGLDRCALAARSDGNQRSSDLRAVDVAKHQGRGEAD